MLEPLAISLIEGSTARIAFAARRFLIGCLALAVFVVAVPSPTSTQRQLGSIQGNQLSAISCQRVVSIPAAVRSRRWNAEEDLS